MIENYYVNGGLAMFKFRGDLRANIYYRPAHDKCGRFVVTSPNICNPDFIDDLQNEETGEIDYKFLEDTGKYWEWLNLEEPSKREEVLKKMLDYQYEFPDIIFLCEQKIIDLLTRFGVRKKYPNWQAIDSDELEARLKEVYGYLYIKEGGYIA